MLANRNQDRSSYLETGYYQESHFLQKRALFFLLATTSDEVPKLRQLDTIFEAT